jgi:hypothetical protein
VADGLLDLADGVGQRERLLVGRAEDVEREPLRGALPDAGQARELGDQTVDRRCEQTGKRISGVGRFGLETRQPHAAQAARTAQPAGGRAHLARR